MTDATITIAGTEYALPVLAPRQNRIVIPLIDRCVPKVNETRAASLIDPADESKGVNPFRWTVALIESGAYEDMCALTAAALTRAVPEMTREAFDNLPVDTFELLAALPVIGKQAGLIR